MKMGFIKQFNVIILLAILGVFVWIAVFIQLHGMDERAV
jgi:hypothetical protein